MSIETLLTHWQKERDEIGLRVDQTVLGRVETLAKDSAQHRAVLFRQADAMSRLLEKLIDEHKDEIRSHNVTWNKAQAALDELET